MSEPALWVAAGATVSLVTVGACLVILCRVVVQLASGSRRTTERERRDLIDFALRAMEKRDAVGGETLSTHAAERQHRMAGEAAVDHEEARPAAEVQPAQGDPDDMEGVPTTDVYKAMD